MEVVEELATQNRVCKLAQERFADPVKQLQLLENNMMSAELRYGVIGNASIETLQQSIQQRLENTEATDLGRQILLTMELLSLALVQHDLHGIFQQYHKLALLHVMSNNMTQAAACWVKRCEAAALLHDETLSAEANLDAGRAYRALGQADVTIAYLQRAIAQALASKQHALASRAYGELGQVYSRLGLAQQALDAHQKQLHFAEDCNLPHANLCDAFGHVGWAHVALEQYKEAKELFDRQLHVSAETGDPVLCIQAHMNQGHCCVKIRHLQKAFGHLEQALELSQKTGNRTASLEALTVLGETYQHELEDEKAMGYFSQLQDLADCNSELDIYYHAIASIAECLLDMEKNQEAEQMLISSLDSITRIPVHIERQRCVQAVFAPPYRVFNLLERMFIKGDRQVSALAFADGGRARCLLRSISDKCSLEEKRCNWQDDLHDYQKYLEGVRRTARETGATLVAYGISDHLELHWWIIPPDSEDIHFHQVKLQVDSASVISDFRNLFKFASNSASAAAKAGSLSADQTAFHALNEGPNSTANHCLLRIHETQHVTAEPFHNKCIGCVEDPAAWQEALGQLHDLLVAPILSYLPDPNIGALLGIVPCGPLWQVPWNALYNTSTRRFLVQDYCLFLVPSIAVLDLLNERHMQLVHHASALTFSQGTEFQPTSVKNLVVDVRPSSPTVEGPLVMGSGGMLHPSHILEDEAKHVGALVDAPPILAAGATVQRLLSRLETASLVHLSVLCHTEEHVSLTKPTSTSMAFLQLSHGPQVIPPEDHWLSSHDLAKHDVRTSAEVVVLPHCDVSRRPTNLAGDADPPEGPAALMHAWLLTAAPCLVLTLWDLPHHSAVPFIRPFYTALRNAPESTFTPRGAMRSPKRQTFSTPVADLLRADSFSLPPLSPSHHQQPKEDDFPVVTESAVPYVTKAPPLTRPESGGPKKVAVLESPERPSHIGMIEDPCSPVVYLPPTPLRPRSSSSFAAEPDAESEGKRTSFVLEPEQDNTVQVAANKSGLVPTSVDDPKVSAGTDFDPASPDMYLPPTPLKPRSQIFEDEVDNDLHTDGRHPSFVDQPEQICPSEISDQMCPTLPEPQVTNPISITIAVEGGNDTSDSLDAMEPNTPDAYLPPTPLRPKTSEIFEAEEVPPTPHSVHFASEQVVLDETVDDQSHILLPGPLGRAPAVKARSVRYAVLQNMHQHHDKPWLWASWCCVGSPF